MRRVSFFPFFLSFFLFVLLFILSDEASEAFDSFDRLRIFSFLFSLLTKEKNQVAVTYRHLAREKEKYLSEKRKGEISAIRTIV